LRFILSNPHRAFSPGSLHGWSTPGKKATSPDHLAGLARA
jgi:hypothetical protein